MLMTCPYREVHRVGVWHVLRLYHRLMMAGGTTEALAETVCSLLTQQGRGCSGRKPMLGDLLNAARLRGSGVTGSGHDMGFIGRTLDIYFRGKPWHFIVNKRAVQRRALAHPTYGPVVSPALRRYRTSLLSGVRFDWLAGGLRSTAANCARSNISVVVDGGSGSAAARAELVRNPKAGLVLRSLGTATALHEALRKMILAAEPSTLDSRIWELLDASRASRAS